MSKVPNGVETLPKISIAWVGCTRGVFRICWRGRRKRGPKGRDARPVGPRAGVGFLGRGQLAPSLPARGPGDHCKLPQRGLGRSPGRQTVLLHFKYSGWPLLTLFYVFDGDGGRLHPAPPTLVNPALYEIWQPDAKWHADDYTQIKYETGSRIPIWRPSVFSNRK